MEKRPLIDFTKVKKKRFSTTQYQGSTQTVQTKDPIKEVLTPVLIPSIISETQIDTSSEYDFYLERIITIITQTKPEMLSKQKNLSLPPPELSRVNTRMIWKNFAVTCEALNRPIEHVFSFFDKELGTETSLTGDKQFLMKGRFNAETIQNMLIKYSKEYVRCSNCGSNSTKITKIDRLQQLECDHCKNTKPVAKL